jgi:hypothetical protein
MRLAGFRRGDDENPEAQSLLDHLELWLGLGLFLCHFFPAECLRHSHCFGELTLDFPKRNQIDGIQGHNALLAIGKCETYLTTP